MIRIKRECYDGLISHCIRELPNEACGLIAGTACDKDRHIVKIIPMTNIRKSSVYFEMSPKEQAEAQREIRKSGLTLLGNFHSHPTSGAHLSEEDKRLAYDTALLYMVLSLKERDYPVLRAFEIDMNKNVTEQELLIEE